MRQLFTILFCMVFNLIYAQHKQDYVWIGGYQINENGGANGYLVDFKKSPIKFEYANPPLGFDGNNASICDNDGNLLFYTNGRAVINSDHQIMPHGDSINAGAWADGFWKDPFYGYPGDQDVLILSDPANHYGYYLFHKPNIYYPMIADSFQLHYSYIDLTLDNGLGDLNIKNKKYCQNENLLYFYFTSMQHQNKKAMFLDNIVYL
jgi:hypothetical protein